MKKLRNLLVVCTMAFVLLGCYKVNMNVDIDSKGNMKTEMDFLMEESMLSYTGQGMDELRESMLEGLPKDQKDQIKFKDLEKTIDGTKYVGFTITYPDAKAKDTKDVITIEDNEMVFEMDDSYLDSIGTSGLTSGTDTKELEDAGVEFNITVNMPGKIKEASAGEIDGNQVKINLLKVDKQIKIVSELGNSNTLLYVAIGVGVVIVAAAAFFFFKNKNKNKDDEVTIITTEQTSAEQANKNDTSDLNQEVVADEVEEIEAKTEETTQVTNEVSESETKTNKEETE